MLETSSINLVNNYIKVLIKDSLEMRVGIQGYRQVQDRYRTGASQDTWKEEKAHHIYQKYSVCQSCINSFTP